MDLLFSYVWLVTDSVFRNNVHNQQYLYSGCLLSYELYSYLEDNVGLAQFKDLAQFKQS